MNAEELWLVVFDTDRIKDYIFATPDLRKIRGASALLEFLNRGLQQALGDVSIGASALTILQQHSLQDVLPVTAGGMAVAVLPRSENPEQVIAKIERVYRQETRIATITGAYVKTRRSALDGEFSVVMREAALALRRKKDQKQHGLTLALAPYLYPCDGCRRYVAEYFDAEDEALICGACKRKSVIGKQQRNLFWQDFLAYAGQDWENAEFPKDLDAIGEASEPPGYVGFIYADGNGIGAILDNFNSFREFRSFSEQLDRLIRSSAYEAIIGAFKTPRNRTAPFEFLLMGGDDLMLVVAADAALSVALELTKRFENEAGTVMTDLGLRPLKPLALATAVVIAHDRFPIRRMQELASELLRNAKRESPQGGAIDFMVVTEAGSAAVEKVREEVLTGKSHLIPPLPGEEIVLTRRPYPLKEFQALLEVAKRIKREIPRHQVRALYEDLFHSKAQAQLTGLQIRRDVKRRAVWEDVAEKLGISSGLFPWQETFFQGTRRFKTPLADAVEIYDFVPGEQP